MQHDLDRLIDEAARTITAHDPPAYLRARVLGRLDTPVTRRSTWRWVPAAAAAGLVAVVLIARRPTEPVPSAVGVPVVASAQASAPPVATSPAAAALTPAVVRSARAARGEPVMSEDEVQWRVRAIPALAPVAGVEFTEIQPPPLTIPQLSVQAIGTAAITVAPIDRNPGER